MKVKQLKELLNEVDENITVVIFNGDNELKNIKNANVWIVPDFKASKYLRFTQS